MPKTAVIVGAAGQDGILITALLSKKGYITIPVTRENNIINSSNIHSLLEAHNPDELYYLAAFHHSSESKALTCDTIAADSFDVNVTGYSNFLKAITELRLTTSVFYASSSHIFNPSQSPLNESSPRSLDTHYSISKQASMHLSELYRSVHGMNITNGILFNHESCHRPPNFLSQRICMTAVEIFLKGHGSLEIGNLDAVVDWGAAQDYVEAMHASIQPGLGSDYVISTGSAHTVRDFVETAFLYLGLDYQNYTTTDPLIVQREYKQRIGDSTKLNNATGWKPTTSFSTMIHKMIDHQMQAQSESI